MNYTSIKFTVITYKEGNNWHSKYSNNELLFDLNLIQAYVNFRKIIKYFIRVSTIEKIYS